MAKRDKDTITLGSGKVYLKEYTNTVPATKKDLDDLCVAANELGHIKGGASLEYTQDTYEEKDDLGIVSKIITTDEEVLLKLGTLTWNGNTLKSLLDRCTVSEASGLRTTKIGGAGNAQGKYYVVCFHYSDPVDGDLWVVIVGRKTAGATITFAKDAGTVIEPEFKAKPHDTVGTLVEIFEEIDAA